MADAKTHDTTDQATPTTGGPGVYEGQAAGVSVEVDLTESAGGLAAQAEALRRRVDGPQMTFVVAQVRNDGDTRVTLESVEVEDDGGDVVTMEPATRLVRALRSRVDPYDTRTYEMATQLLEAVRRQGRAVRPGRTSELLLGAETGRPSIANVIAVGSFGRQQLRRR